MKNNQSGISRRNFLQGAAAGAAGIAAVSVLGCAPKQTAANQPAGGTAPVQATKPASISETMTADVVVVGGGNSGLAATVQAAELGAKVILLESQEKTGGNGQATEGIFAAGSKMQKDAGIDIKLIEIVDEENRTFNYRLNSLFWKDMFEASGDNIEWLQKNGVLFSGTVDDYHGMGIVKSFHWWKDGKGTNYSEPMTAKAKELGVQVLTKTAAADLIFENGKVTGIYATKSDSSTIQINCKAVILASGGYAGNTDMMEARGHDMVNNKYIGFPGHNGDGLRMTLAVGGVDGTPNGTFLRIPTFVGLSFLESVAGNLNGKSSLWVNEAGERYVREDLQVTYMDGYAANAILSQQKSFAIVDHGLLEKLSGTVSTIIQDVENAVTKDGGKHFFKADTIEELAGKAGIDAKTLASTLNRYNELCDKGSDEDFNKPAEMLVSLTKGPFYIFGQNILYATSIGGVKTNRKMEVVNKSNQPIPGLYAVGTEGCELYKETYTINKPGSMNGHNINSGRTAGKNAVAALK
jgi:fumarate reductase flavoprotein subunit